MAGLVRLDDPQPVRAGRSIRAGQFELAGPTVLGFVLVVFLIEQISPAERRAVWARGHLLDLVYLLAYATLVVPLIVLTGAGFSAAVTAALMRGSRA